MRLGARARAARRPWAPHCAIARRRGGLPPRRLRRGPDCLRAGPRDGFPQHPSLVPARHFDGWDGKLSRSLQRLARARRLRAQRRRYHGLAGSGAGVDGTAGGPPRRSTTRCWRDRPIGPTRSRAARASWPGEATWTARSSCGARALERYPDAAELLIGSPKPLLERAARVGRDVRGPRPHRGSRDRAVRDLERVVRAALRPEIATNVDGANDSDNNDFVSQEGTVAGSLGDDLRGTLRVGWRRANRPAAPGTSYGGGGSVIAALGKGRCCAPGWACGTLSRTRCRPRL